MSSSVLCSLLFATLLVAVSTAPITEEYPISDDYPYPVPSDLPPMVNRYEGLGYRQFNNDYQDDLPIKRHVDGYGREVYNLPQGFGRETYNTHTPPPGLSRRMVTAAP